MKYLGNFTNQYQVPKTLRFELKPIGQTAQWIKEHNIIYNENGKIKGKDAERAINYKYLKKLLDEMHRLFLDQSLKISMQSAEKFELEQAIKVIETNLLNGKEILEGKYPSILANKSAEVTSGLSQLTKRLFDKTFEYWVWQYKDDMPVYWREDIAELKQKITLTDNKKEINYCRSIIKNIENKIEKSELKANDHKGIFNNTACLQLLEWCIRSNKIKVTGKELGINDDENTLPIAELKTVVRHFDNFSTYLNGFNENRANIYNVKEYLSTSVIYRTFEQNLCFYLTNATKWQNITKFINKNQEKLNECGFDWDIEVRKLEEGLDTCLGYFFAPVNYCEYLNQTGIDQYNQVIGGNFASAGKEKTQGLNEVINLAKQKLGAKRSQMPFLQPLYKQILSKREKSFIDEFKNDQELINELNNFVIEQIDDPNGAVSIISSELTELFAEAKQEQSKIYIPKDKLSILSAELTGSWQAIKKWQYKIFNQADLEKINKKQCYSIAQIQDWFEQEVEGQNFYQFEKSRIEKSPQNKDALLLSLPENQSVILSAIHEKFRRILTDISLTTEYYKQLSLNITKFSSNRDRHVSNGFKQISIIKNMMEACNKLNHFLSHFTVNKKSNLPDDKYDFWYEKNQAHIDKFPIYELYNKTRNYLKKKPFSTEKLKINIENSTLLHGWDRNKETNNRSILFEKAGDFYLGIMTAESNNIFDYDTNEGDSEEKQNQKKSLKLAALSVDTEHFRKINYKLLPGANKMLPKVFFAKKNISLFTPNEEIINIKNKKLYKKSEIEKNGIENLHKFIAFCQQSLLKHPEWHKAFNFSKNTFKEPTEYQSIDQFYRDVEHIGYKLSFDNIKSSYVEDKVSKGELYLFQIYSKDFSKKKKSKGKDNLHTSYWKLLFSEQNLQDVVLKLNGGAEIFYRPASIYYTDEKRKTGHHAAENKNKFNYPILKDKRYSVDKFLFHCPITMNFKASGQSFLNGKVNKFLKNNADVNIIGIDRGEKHLLYISVINQQGEILHQESLNEITNTYVTTTGETGNKTIDYHHKIDNREESRANARKSWTEIENIKELKEGYLSHVIHKLSTLIIQYNAIVVLEDLNKGFKRGRFKIEKQVYQKFEKALIDKLNYLTFKDRESRMQPGHYLSAYQLTNKFKGFDKIGTQSGILYYVNAAYTSTTDPITGFIKNIYKSYKNIDDAKAFWQSFDSIHYLPDTDRFEFCYDTRYLNKTKSKNRVPMSKTKWTVSSHVERSKYNPEHKQHELFVVSDKIKTALAKEGISHLTDHDIKSALVRQSSKAFQKEMMWLFNCILTMRVTDSSKPSGSHQNDYILSPVAPYFDSRNAYQTLPENGDANGAYNIARKGLMLLNKINQFTEGEKQKKPDLFIHNADWQNFTQQSVVVDMQKQKLP